MTPGTKRVRIGSPVYIINGGSDVIIDCRIISGTRPITIKWLHNGSPDPTRGNVSTITITDAQDRDIFQCRADNSIGFDTENTTIIDIGGRWIMHVCMHTYTYVNPIHTIKRTYICG